VLREMQGADLRIGEARARLPRGPRVARLRGVLRRRGASHLRQVRARDGPAAVKIMEMGFDLAAYLKRIGQAGALQPDYATLAALHLAHATHIPFENLDILLGRPIRLDIGSLQEKMVRGARGGYCFEQNLLFAAALEAIGFRFTQLAGRVCYRTS